MAIDERVLAFDLALGEMYFTSEVLQFIGPLFARPAWQADAACREHPDVNFFPARGERAEPAKAVCAGCLVREECTAFAFEHDDHLGGHGVWGGMSARQRRRARRAARAREPAFAIDLCGRSAGRAPCRPCLRYRARHLPSGRLLMLGH